MKTKRHLTLNLVFWGDFKLYSWWYVKIVSSKSSYPFAEEKKATKVKVIKTPNITMLFILYLP